MQPSRALPVLIGILVVLWLAAALVRMHFHDGVRQSGHRRTTDAQSVTVGERA
jgi:hypothetical protein